MIHLHFTVLFLCVWTLSSLSLPVTDIIRSSPSFSDYLVSDDSSSVSRSPSRSDSPIDIYTTNESPTDNIQMRVLEVIKSAAYEFMLENTPCRSQQCAILFPQLMAHYLSQPIHIHGEFRYLRAEEAFILSVHEACYLLSNHLAHTCFQQTELYNPRRPSEVFQRHRLAILSSFIPNYDPTFNPIKQAQFVEDCEGCAFNNMVEIAQSGDQDRVALNSPTVSNNDNNGN